VGRGENAPLYGKKLLSDVMERNMLLSNGKKPRPEKNVRKKKLHGAEGAMQSKVKVRVPFEENSYNSAGIMGDTQVSKTREKKCHDRNDSGRYYGKEEGGASGVFLKITPIPPAGGKSKRKVPI